MSIKELATKLKRPEDWNNWIILARTAAGPVWHLCNPELLSQPVHLARPTFPEAVYINSGASTPGSSNAGTNIRNISQWDLENYWDNSH